MSASASARLEAAKTNSSSAVSRPARPQARTASAAVVLTRFIVGTPAVRDARHAREHCKHNPHVRIAGAIVDSMDRSRAGAALAAWLLLAPLTAPPPVAADDSPEEVFE